MKLLLPSRYPSVFRRSSGLASDNPAPPLHSNAAPGESCQNLATRPSSSTINPLEERRPTVSVFALTFCSSRAFFELV